MDRRLVRVMVVLAAVLAGGAAGDKGCCNTPPHGPQTVTPLELTVPCSGLTQCQNKAATLACATAVACNTDGTCKFAATNSATCECYEGDVRECPSGGGKWQYCVRNGSLTAAQWARSGSAPRCSPEVCPTGNPGCSTGTSTYDPVSATWGACVPDPSCPSSGQTRPCTPSNPMCLSGTQTFNGTAWSACVDQQCQQTYAQDHDGDGYCNGTTAVSLNPMGSGWILASQCVGTEGLTCDNDANVQCLDTDQTVTGRSMWTGTGELPVLDFTANGTNYQLAGDADLIHEIGMWQGSMILEIYGTDRGAAGGYGEMFDVRGYRLVSDSTGDTWTIGVADTDGTNVFLQAGTRLQLEPGALVTKIKNERIGWKVAVVGKPDGALFKIWRMVALRKVH